MKNPLLFHNYTIISFRICITFLSCDFLYIIIGFIVFMQNISNVCYYGCNYNYHLNYVNSYNFNRYIWHVNRDIQGQLKYWLRSRILIQIVYQRYSTKIITKIVSYTIYINDIGWTRPNSLCNNEWKGRCGKVSCGQLWSRS